MLTLTLCASLTRGNADPPDQEENIVTSASVLGKRVRGKTDGADELFVCCELAVTCVDAAGVANVHRLGRWRRSKSITRRQRSSSGNTVDISGRGREATCAGRKYTHDHIAGKVRAAVRSLAGL